MELIFHHPSDFSLGSIDWKCVGTIGFAPFQWVFPEARPQIVYSMQKIRLNVNLQKSWLEVHTVREE